MEQVKKGLKKTEVGVIPKDWESVNLNTLIDPKRTIRYGIVQPGKFDTNGKFLIRGQDYSSGWVTEDLFFKVSPQIEEPYKNARVIEGDVIITIVGASTGHVEIIPKWLDGSNLTQTTARLAIDAKKASNKYIKQYLASKKGKEQVANYIKGAAQPGLNCGDIEKFNVPLPPTLTEQNAIATALSDVDELIANLEKLLEKKKAIKQGAMQQLLTPPHKGGKRLDGFSGEWVEKRLGDCLTMSATYGVVKAGNFVTQGVKMVRGGDIKRGVIKLDEIPNISFEKSIEYSRTKLEKSDVLIALVGYPGESAIVPDILIGHNISRAVGLLRLNKTLDASFLVQLLNSENGRRMVLAPSAGSAQIVVNLNAMNNLVLEIPSIAEQKAAAKILTEMDLDILATENSKSKFEQIKLGMMQELLTGRTRLI